MLNVSSPALYDENNSSNVSIDNFNKKNTSMMGDTSSRPTLFSPGQNTSNENLSLEGVPNKTTYEFKIILLGSSSVGKTSILTRYINNEFNSNQGCTTNVDFKAKMININKTVQANLKIWDTCGDEKYHSIASLYYKDAQGILLVYDITNRNSFDRIINWENEVRNNAPKDSVLFLVGNKTDLNRERQISNQEGKNKAEELGMIFTEVSAKDGDNIHLLFEKMSEAIMECVQNKPESTLNSNTIKDFGKSDLEDLKNPEETMKKKICC